VHRRQACQVHHEVRAEEGEAGVDVALIERVELLADTDSAAVQAAIAKYDN
jgi:hypothetical protein